jgi:putative inorganic carbon (HCO3(-)) transporter
MASTSVTPPGVVRRAGGGASHKLLAFEPLWVLVLSPFLIFPGRFIVPHWQPWIVVATFIFWPLRWWIEGSVFLRTPIRLATLLFLLAIPIPVIVSTNPVRTWEALSYLVIGIVFASAVIAMPLFQRRPFLLACGLAMIGVTLALLGPLVITDASVGGGILTQFQNAAGPLTAILGETINPNILANALLAVIPFAAAFALRGNAFRKGWIPWFFAASTLLMAAVIYLSESRGALLALAVILPLLLVLRFPRLLWLTPLVVLGAIILIVTSGPTLLDALTQASGGSATSGFVERVELWQRGLYAIQDFPITGIGMGTYGTVVPFLYPFLIIPPNTFLPDAHNLPIQVGVDLGIPGLVTWLAMLLCIFVMMAQVLRRTHDPMRWALAAAVLASFVGYLVAGIFAATNWGVKPAFLPWLVGAVGVLVYRQQTMEDALPSEAGTETSETQGTAIHELHP